LLLQDRQLQLLLLSNRLELTHPFITVIIIKLKITTTSINNLQKPNTMTVTEAKILTEETVPAYLESHLDKLQDVFPTKDAVLKAKAIQGGNVNYAFCVTCENSGATVFLKQAPEFVAIFGPDGFPLTSDRMQQEIVSTASHAVLCITVMNSLFKNKWR